MLEPGAAQCTVLPRVPRRETLSDTEAPLSLIRLLIHAFKKYVR